MLNLKIKEMEKNMGKVDKVIRLIIAAIITTLYFTNVINGIFGIVLIVLSAVFVLTSLVSFCPLYLLFGLKTCKVKDTE